MAETLSHSLYSYMERGEYTAQVKHWREVFPETSFLYIKFDDLIDPGEGLEIYRRICDFAGVQSSHHIADRNQASNVAAEPHHQWLRDLLYKLHIVKRLLGRAIPSQNLRARIAVTVDKWNQNPRVGGSSPSSATNKINDLGLFWRSRKEHESPISHQRRMDM